MYLQKVHTVWERRQKMKKRPKIIICTIMDTRKRQIILHNSSTYLRGTNVCINEDRTLMQQKAIREKVVARKAKIEKKKNKEEVENNHNNAYGDAAHGTSRNLHIMYWNCRGFPWYKR